MIESTRATFVFAVAISTTAIVGCTGSDRPPLAEVSGVVTIDGKPLPRVIVIFECGDLRPSSGITDDAGRYQLGYLRDTTGAAIGPHTVRIRRFAKEEGIPVEEMFPRYDR